ncbi:MAG: sigma-70 family RNA polymerase sigma factor [Lachnospiraceae bacterium]
MVNVYKLQRRLLDMMPFIKSVIYNLVRLIVSSAEQEGGKNVIFMQNALHAAQINEQAEQLMKNYGNSVLRLAYSYLHNMSDAEDVLQDTLIQFLKTQPQFKNNIHEKAWFLRVAINISKNKSVYNKIRAADELSETLSAAEEADLAFVWEAVKQLPTKYREVVHLYYHEGYNTVQIASLLSKKEATIRSLLQRARMMLREVLKEVYDFEE